MTKYDEIFEPFYYCPRCRRSSGDPGDCDVCDRSDALAVETANARGAVDESSDDTPRRVDCCTCGNAVALADTRLYGSYIDRDDESHDEWQCRECAEREQSVLIDVRFKMAQIMGRTTINNATEPVPYGAARVLYDLMEAAGLIVQEFPALKDQWVKR